jgi:pimeloyl-ACP methyl ester carboxylesterase
VCRYDAPTHRLTRIRLAAPQARRDAWPRIADLLQPWLEPPPAPLLDTLPPRALADADSRFIRLNGVDVHYKLCASGGPHAADADVADAEDDSPLVLCLHGFNGSTFSFRDPVLSGLAAAGGSATRLRAVAFDRPPFGLSSRPAASELPAGAPDPYSDEGGVALALALIDVLRPRSVIVLGHSAGAPLALAVARASPARVAALVLVSPALPASSAREDSFLGRADAGTWLRLAALRAVLAADAPGLSYVRRTVTRRASEVRASGDIGYAGGARAPEDAVDGYLLPLRAERWDEASLAQFRAFGLRQPPPPAPGELRTTAPAAIRAESAVESRESREMRVLVVQGTDDAVIPTPGVKKLVAAWGAACEYVELPRVGHLPMEEAPLAFLDAVVPFVRRELVDGDDGGGDDSASSAAATAAARVEANGAAPPPAHAVV